MEQNDRPEQQGAIVQEAECAACVPLRAVGPDMHTFELAPADGGGWEMWSAALLRLLQRVGHEPTRAIIISQPFLNDRYVQVMVGHGIANAEVGSNVYLTGDSRLSNDQEELLALIGWQEPASDISTFPARCRPTGRFRSSTATGSTSRGCSSARWWGSSDSPSTSRSMWRPSVSTTRAGTAPGPNIPTLSTSSAPANPDTPRS